MVRYSIAISDNDNLYSLFYSWHRTMIHNDSLGNYIFPPHYPITHHTILQYPRNKLYQLFYNEIVPNYYQIKESLIPISMKQMQQKILSCDLSVVSQIEQLLIRHIEFQYGFLSCLQTMFLKQSLGTRKARQYYRKCHRRPKTHNCLS